MLYERLEEIKNSDAFQCHKTVDYEHEDDPRLRQGDHPQQCAGLMAVLIREHQYNTIMKVAMVYGHLKPDEIDPDAEAYATWQQVIDAHVDGVEP